MKIEDIKKNLQNMLDECMSSYNQEGSLIITEIVPDDSGLEGTGTIEFDWCTPEPDNDEQPYFVGY